MTLPLISLALVGHAGAQAPQGKALFPVEQRHAVFHAHGARGADLFAGSAARAQILKEQKLRGKALGFGIAAPEAAERAAFQKHGGSDAGGRPWWTCAECCKPFPCSWIPSPRAARAVPAAFCGPRFPKPPGDRCSALMRGGGAGPRRRSFYWAYSVRLIISFCTPRSEAGEVGAESATRTTRSL